MAKTGIKLEFITLNITDTLPVPGNPFTVYFVRDGLNHIQYITDASGTYLSEAVPSGTVYGSELNVFVNNSVLTNTTTTVQGIINSTTTFLPIGKYKIKINYSWNSNSTQDDFESRLLFDGSALDLDVTGLIHKEEAKDSAGTANGTGSLQVLSFNKEFVVDVTTTGTKTVLLTFNSSKVGCMVSVWNCTIECYRIN
tara:strand:- start:395 stop:985 length:591 start_codon:yes stop_codon:yes gene_type:complete